MKTIVKSIVVILLFSVSLSAQSQENEDTVLRNHPHFMVDGVRWFEFYHDMFLEDEGITLSTSSFFDVSQYEIHGDSIVDGKEYKIIESTFYIHYGNGDVFEKKGLTFRKRKTDSLFRLAYKTVFYLPLQTKS